MTPPDSSATPAQLPTCRQKIRAWAGWPTVFVGIYFGGAIWAVLVIPEMLLSNWVTADTPEEFEQRKSLLGTAGQLVLFTLGGGVAVIGVALSMARHRQEAQAAARDADRLFDQRERDRLETERLEQQRQDDRERDRQNTERYERQRLDDRERELRSRFVTLVELLASTEATTRQAALYGLGALADDWHSLGRSEEVQVCIEVLCAYLRAPRTEVMLVPLTPAERGEVEDPARKTNPQEISVKEAGYSIIHEHLYVTGEFSWGARTLNLSGAFIDFNVDLNSAKISNNGSVNLSRAHISERGLVNLSYADISNRGRVNLSHADISKIGRVDLSGTKISDNGRAYLHGTKISGNGSVNLARTKVSDEGTVNLSHAVISDNGLVYLPRVRIGGIGSVSLSRARISEEGSVDFDGARISDEGRVDFDGATITHEGSVNFDTATITHEGRVDFDRATISGKGRVDFDRATISGKGRVDFARATISGKGRVNLDGATITDEGPVRLPDGRHMVLKPHRHKLE